MMDWSVSTPGSWGNRRETLESTMARARRRQLTSDCTAGWWASMKETSGSTKAMLVNMPAKWGCKMAMSESMPAKWGCTMAKSENMQETSGCTKAMLVNMRATSDCNQVMLANSPERRPCPQGLGWLPGRERIGQRMAIGPGQAKRRRGPATCPASWVQRATWIPRQMAFASRGRRPVWPTLRGSRSRRRRGRRRPSCLSAARP